MTEAKPGELRLGRSVAAILIGIAINVVLALGLDTLFHMTGVFPPMDQGMFETSDNLLALGYRMAIAVLAGVVTLRFAGYAPGRHALVLGGIGLALATAGAVATTMAMTTDLGPDWYPWALAISVIPCTWLAWAVARRSIA